MRGNVTIRAATQSDLPAVVALWQEHQEYHAQFDPYFARALDANPGFLKFLQESLDHIGLFVAEIDQYLVGFVLAEIARRPPCFAQRDYGMIDDLAVTAAWRRKGIGQKLLARATTWFTEKGIHRIEARFLRENELASNFWRKAGFEIYMHGVYKVVVPDGDSL